MAWNDKNFEEKMTKYIDEIYKKLFGNRLINIYRSERNKENNQKLLFMDIELAIDTHLTFLDKSILTFQEKTRRNNFLKFNDFTFEYYNDPKTKEQGEWFKLASQLYFYGYANKFENGYDKFWILNVVKLRTQLMNNYSLNQLESKYLRYNKFPAKSNFFAIPFTVLEQMKNVILYKYEIQVVKSVNF